MLQEDLEEIKNQDIDISDLQDPDADDGGEFKFESDEQKAIVSALVGSEDLAKIVRDTLSPKAFTAKIHRSVVEIVLDHYGKYGTLPSKKTCLTGVKERHGEDKALVVFLGEANALYEYPSADYAYGYLVDRVKQFARQDLGKRAFAKWMESCKKGTPDYQPLKEALRKVDALDSGNVGRRPFFPADLEALPPLRWAVEKHFVEGGFDVVYGPYGSKKTFYTLAMALCRSEGLPFLGHATTPTKVCYVTGEGHSGFRKRIWAWCREHGLDMADLKNFVLIPYQFNLQEASEVETLAQMAKDAFGGQMPGLFVFDTLAKMFGPGDVSSAKDMGSYVNNLVKLQDIGQAENVKVSVLSIAHTGKDTARGIMGSNVLPGACDSIVRMEDTGRGVRVRFDKQKDGSKDLQYDFATKVVEVPADLDPSGEGTLVLTTEGRPYDYPTLSDEKVKALLKVYDKYRTEPFTWGNFKDVTGINAKVTCTRYLEDFKAKGYLCHNERVGYSVCPDAVPTIRSLAKSDLASDGERANLIVKPWEPSETAFG